MFLSIYQQRYWNLLKELKVHVIYLQEYEAHSEKWDKGINIFLAITSSSSVAAWAVWLEYQLFWASIIMLSQLVAAVKPLLPFKQRLKSLGLLNNDIQKISLECEKRWYDVSEGVLSVKEIHDLYIDLKNQSISSEQKSLKGIVLPKNDKWKTTNH